MTTPREQARAAAQELRKKSYEKMPSGLCERYEHPVHGVGRIVDHRPVVERGKELEPPFIEVLLEFEAYEFWTGACFLDTMEYIQNA